MQTVTRPDRLVARKPDFFLRRQNTHAAVSLAASSLTDATAGRLREQLAQIKNIIDCVTVELPYDASRSRKSETELSDLATFCLTNGMAFGLKVLPREII